MMSGIRISQEIFAIDELTALKPTLKHDRKHVLQFLRLYGGQALKPGLHISRKNRKHRLENMFFKLSSYGLVSVW